MIKDFFNYEVKIKDSLFISKSGLKYENTVAISFFDANKKEIACIELGFVKAEHIYRLIDEGEPINIDQCYVEDFSLDDYRASRNMGRMSYVKINGFSAYGTFFDTQTTTDFSYSEFADSHKTFENAYFLNG